MTICGPVRRDGSGHRENCGELCDGMLWLAPAGLRGGIKLEAYHQSRQPLPFSLSAAPGLLGFGSLFRMLRRPSGQLLRQRQCSPHQTLRRLFHQLLRQRQSLVDLSILDSCIFSSQMIRHPHGSGCCDINTFLGCPNIHNYNHDVLFAPANWLRKWRSLHFPAPSGHSGTTVRSVPAVL